LQDEIGSAGCKITSTSISASSGLRWPGRVDRRKFNQQIIDTIMVNLLLNAGAGGRIGEPVARNRPLQSGRSKPTPCFCGIPQGQKVRRYDDAQTSLILHRDDFGWRVNSRCRLSQRSVDLEDTILNKLPKNRPSKTVLANRERKVDRLATEN
jgi:hypothetical protein